jgi:CRP-like cAMP-binding protein
VFSEDDEATAMYVILRGTVSIQKSKHGTTSELAQLGPNEVMGEVSLFGRRTRTASAVALTDLDTLEISFEALDNFYDTVPDFLKIIFASMSDRLRKADDRIQELEERLAER